MPEETQAVLFKKEIEALLAKYPNVRLTISQEIKINEVPDSAPISPVTPSATTDSGE